MDGRQRSNSAGAAGRKRRGASGDTWLGRLGPDFGGSLVEVALIMPIFSLLILGSAEFGILAYDAVEVTNAAFAGASYGSQSHETAADTANIQLAATTDAADVSGMSAAVAHTCGCSNGTTISTITCSTAATSCVSPSHIIEYVQVTTSATVNPIALYKGSPTSFTLTGKSILVVQK